MRCDVQVPTLTRRGLTVAEVAEVLGISTRSIWRLVSTGELPAFRPTVNTTRIAPDVLERFISDKQVAGFGR